MKRIALILALAMSGMAHAGTLGLHIGSYHFPAQDYNNANPGAYYIHDNGLRLARTTTANAASPCTLGGHGTLYNILKRKTHL